MKKLLFAAFALTVALSMTAQGHMKFKGIEITGTMSDFEKQIVSQGFLVSSDDYFTKGHDNCKTYKGNFTGEDVSLILQSTVKSHIIYAVSVVYNGEFFWPGLKEQYMDMKKLLSAKYGKPSEVTELFDEGFSEESLKKILKEEVNYLYKNETTINNERFLNKIDEDISSLDDTLKTKFGDINGIVYKFNKMDENSNPIVGYSDERKIFQSSKVICA